MRIQHNIMAMNAYRNYNTNTSALSKNLEKLSSGYKINRAGDDAAGLAISEKMRAQITGLNAAQKNVKDGISLVKTAEGAMQEIQDMLNRMDYLATQSANGTYDDDVDRMNLQKEVDQLRSEINRIADSANFNGIKLLDGSLDGVGKTQSAQDAANAAANAAAAFKDVTVDAKIDAVKAETPSALKFDVELGELTMNFDVTIAAGSTSGSKSTNITIGGETFAVKATAAIASASASAVIKTVSISASDIAKQIMGSNGAGGVATKATATIGGAKFTVTMSGTKLSFAMQTAAANIDAYTATTNLTVSVGTTASITTDKGNTAAVNITQNYNKGGTSAHAQGEFTITASMVKDGAQLQIGKTVFTFAVGSDSKVTGSNVIDLKKYKSDATGLDKKAAIALSKLNNPGNEFTITSDNTTAKVQLTSRDGVNTNYELVGGSTSGSDAAWTLTSASDAKSIVGWRASAPQGAGTVAKTGYLTLQIGDTSESFNQLSVSIGDLHVGAMGTGTYIDEKGVKQTVTKTIKDISIAKQSGAQEAIQVIKNAINYVSSIRGDLGATQNRLEHTANNLSVMAENIQDAESTIRDTDVAEEMMAYTKNNILIQSAQAMLAQANAVPQGVLQLLG